MAVIDTYETTSLPETIATAKSTPYTRKILYSGYAIDGRPLTSADVRDYYVNTKRLMEDGLIPGVKKTHYQQEPELMGFIDRIELKTEVEDPESCEMWARINLYPHLNKLYKEGYMPYLSIDPVGDSKTRRGDDIGPSILAVSLLGKDQPALHQLRESGILSRIRQAMTGIATALRSVTGGFKQVSNKEVSMKIDNEKLMMYSGAFRQICEIAQAGAIAIDEMMGAAGDGVPDSTEQPTQETPAAYKQVAVEEPKKPEEENKKPQSLQSTLAKSSTLSLVKAKSSTLSLVKAESAFRALVKNGNAVRDDRARFNQLVDEMGLDKSVTWFAQNRVQQPPNPLKLKSDRTVKDTRFDESHYRSIATRLGLRGDRLEAYLKAEREEVLNGTHSP